MDALPRRFINPDRRVTVKRKDAISVFNLDGFILDASKNLLLLEYYYDFFFDGYRIVRVADVETIKHSSTDRFHENVIRDEGLRPIEPVVFRVPLESWESVARWLQGTSRVTIVEVEGPEYEQFIIGRVEAVSPRTVKVRYIDGAGRVMKRLTSIPLADVTQIHIGSNYQRMYEKYGLYKDGSGA